MIKDLKELYAYRQMIFSLVKKDLRGRYKGSVLGFMWTFINPLLQMGVYTLVFSIILRNDIDKYYLGTVDFLLGIFDGRCRQCLSL